MHSQPMPETAGEFQDEKVASCTCPKCQGEVRYKVWESSCGGYEDIKYRCTKCGHTWWVDGPDS